MEKIRFTCPDCQTQYSALPTQIGKKGKCKNCGADIEVPRILTKNPELRDKKPKSSDDRGRYWFGYIYALFVGYLSLVSFWNFLAVLIRPDRFFANDISVVVETWGLALARIVLSIWLGYVCVGLFRQKYSLKVIYIIAALHAANVIIHGLIPIEIFYWMFFSGCAIIFFRRLEAQKAIKANNPKRLTLHSAD